MAHVSKFWSASVIQFFLKYNFFKKNFNGFQTKD